MRRRSSATWSPYLAGASALKREIELNRAHGASSKADRRTKPRFARGEVPWVSVVRLGNDQAELIDVSVHGALLQTSARPGHEYLRRTDPNIRRRSRVTFELEWGHEIHATGRVIRSCLREPAIGRTTRLRFRLTIQSASISRRRRGSRSGYIRGF